MSELDAGLVEQVASLLRDARYTVIACIVLLLWDMCIRLSDEVRFTFWFSLRLRTNAFFCR